VGVLALLSNQNREPAAAPTSSATTSTEPSITPRPTPSATPTSNTVAIDLADYQGRNGDEVAAELNELGLSASVEDGNAATADDEVGLVYQINPRGNVPKGTTVVVTVYAAVTEPTPPTAAPTASDSTIAQGEDVEISWPAYTTCPSGTEVAGYAVAVEPADGVTFDPQNPTTAEATSVTVQNLPAGQARISYQAFCGPNESGYSPPVTVTVTPAPTPTDDSGGGDEDGDGGGDQNG
jgi:hypothetical protein